MKKIISSVLILVSMLFNKSVLCGQDYFALLSEKDSGRLIESSANKPMLLFKTFAEANEERSYISDNVSSVSVVKHENSVYINWNVCDDNTQSCFFVTKTTDNKNYQWVGDNQASSQDRNYPLVYNTPSEVGIPLLYGIVDNKPMKKTTFYKLYKICEEGEIKHIVTVILPIPVYPKNKVRNKIMARVPKN